MYATGIVAYIDAVIGDEIVAIDGRQNWQTEIEIRIRWLAALYVERQFFIAKCLILLLQFL